MFFWRRRTNTQKKTVARSPRHVSNRGLDDTEMTQKTTLTGAYLETLVMGSTTVGMTKKQESETAHQAVLLLVRRRPPNRKPGPLTGHRGQFRPADKVNSVMAQSCYPHLPMEIFCRIRSVTLLLSPA
jgi:hypothetical protein